MNATLEERLMAASHDDRLATGALYREAATAIATMRPLLERALEQSARVHPDFADAIRKALA
jgi:hypothetical protein